MMAQAVFIPQAMLVVLCLASGAIKLTQPRQVLAAGPMRWATAVTDAQLRAIGALEVLAALALILAAALYTPSLTAFPGTGLSLLMLCAIVAQSR
jgi:DoxX-like family